MTTPRSKPFTPVPRGTFTKPCCARCKTPHNCGNSGCACHDTERAADPRRIIARTVADLALDPTIPPRRGRIGLHR